MTAPSSPFCFLHLTDTHLVPPGRLLYGLDPAARLRAAVADIVRRHGPDGAAPAAFALLTGDLVHHGAPESYALLREILAALPMPVHLLLGNHDDRTQFRAAFPEAPADPNGFVQSAFATPVGRFLLLDTNLPGTAAGGLCAQRLGWLAERLAEAPAAPVFLALHHPPARSGIVGMDQIPLRDAAALWAVLAPHRARIRHIFHGHLHRPFAGSWHGIPFSSLRGTSHQVALDLAERTTVPGSHEPPAYALVRVSDEEEVVVHAHDFLDATAGFDL